MELFTLSEIKRPPLRYHGGKFRLAPWIIPQIPEHRVYVDIFGGGAGVLLRKTRSKIEIYNDLDENVVNVFRVMRDPLELERLCRLIALTPFSRDEFKDSYVWAGDPVEAAAGRFVGVTIENLDYRKLIPKFDCDDVFFYADPPYLAETRDAGGKGYVHEMNETDHRQLAWMLRNIKGKVAISGYPSALYDELYRGWRCAEKAHQANGQRGSVPRVEKLWMNY